MRLSVSDLTIDIFAKVIPPFFDRFKDFTVNQLDNKADINIILCPVDNLSLPTGEVVLDDLRKWIIHNTLDHSTTVFQCSNRAPATEPIFVVEAKNEWSEVKISFLANNKSVIEDVAALLGTVVLKNKLALNNGLIVHAAALTWRDKGLLFTAPSGVGKSTQADLWFKLNGAKILNDDTPPVRLFDGYGVVYGTPWCGSRNICSAVSEKLSTIIVLEQAPVNKIARLSCSNAATALIPRCFLPYHDQRLLDKTLVSLSQLLETTPVYLLKCRPDADAVKLVEECLE